MGGGAFEPKTVVGVSKKAFYKKKKKAFTLAEVLITLAIIGVVAALTIPTVVAKYQKNVYYTQFMKMYNTLSNAFDLAEVDHGNLSEWGFSSGEDVENANKIIDILKEYLKVGVEPTSFGNVSGIKSLGYSEPIASYSEYASIFPHLFLSDGSAFFIPSVSSEDAFIVIDCNGIKEPNILGRDIFTFLYKKDKGFVPEDPYDDESAKRRCDSENPSTRDGSGASCADRLLQEGKMNY